jgi:Trypsin-like peptidase domain/PEGA domain
MGNKKNDLSAVKSSFSACRMVALVAICGFFGVPICHSQTEEGSLAVELRQNVVAIEVSNRSGFGFITGERAGLLYIATARHVLYPSDEPDSVTITKVKVTFFSDQGRTYEADVLGTHDEQHDLAVLAVPDPPGFSWSRKCLSGPENEKRGTPVWFIGKNAKWFVPVQPGAIASLGPSTKGMLEIDGLQVRVGTSGGPLIAKSGIVGMIQNDSEDDTRALTIDIIKAALLEWNYPWDLTYTSGSTPPPPPPASCTVAVESDPPEASITLDGIARGQTPADLDLVSGKTYALVVAKEGSLPYKQRIDCGSKKVSATLKPATGDIKIHYGGDPHGCNLGIQITVGDESFRPTGYLFSARGVPLGSQDFSISGTIGCPGPVFCQASGSGTIDVRDGATYEVSWLNTSFGHCDVSLVGQ